ncbi:MAG: glucose-1-phosphate thymidylyltransferase RfbA, partial [Myxococcota bacterium]
CSPVYDKPMIYYPLATLMLAGVREVLMITTPQDQASFQTLLKNGTQWGIDIQWAVQERPDGLAQAFIIGREFARGEPCALILGDNIFFGHGLTDALKRGAQTKHGATVFAYGVRDPERYGVVELGPDQRALSIEEKPSAPKSHWAVTGLYFYDGRASDFAAQLTPSSRGELEITDLNRRYLDEGSLQVELLGRGYAWLDTGTHSSLIAASEFVRTVQERQGMHVASLEEIAFREGFIEREALLQLAASGPPHMQGYLERVARE